MARVAVSLANSDVAATAPSGGGGDSMTSVDMMIRRPAVMFNLASA
jgi:hypothetical protein